MFVKSVSAVLLSFATVVAMAPAASAKPKPDPEPTPKPVCNLLVDPRGDTTVDTDHLDILSGDIATTSTSVTAVVRVASLTSSDPVASTGSRWDFTFAAGTTKYRFTARRSATGNMTAELVRDVDGTPFVVATPALKIGPTEVRWVAPRKAVRELTATVGTVKLHNLGATTYAGATEVAVDHAASPVAYLDGTPSCVNPA